MTTKRRYDIGFGTSFSAEGTMFRLCAPAAGTVTLRLLRQDRELPMTRNSDGWYSRKVPDVAAGELYQFVINGNQAAPDPASRFQPQDVNGPSELIDPESFTWTDTTWKGRPWHEAVIYELHVGTFTPEGTYQSTAKEFERLATLGVTAIELMPLSDSAGAHNWGYDGVLPFAPESSYGRPEDLKAMICAAHRHGLMVFIDVVYNHFGPEGNYLGLYAPNFFSQEQTDWGQALDFKGPTRQFFISNALYWIAEYHVDGLRLDAVHAIQDTSKPGFLEELATKIRVKHFSRPVHLVLENDKNDPYYLGRRANNRPKCYDAQWNDDFHHTMHVLLTGETDGYYADYADEPIIKLGRALTSGFVYQGEPSPSRGKPRGASSMHLPPLAFVNFLQNHDQIGNRAFGDRLITQAPRPALFAAIAILLLAPSPPLLFMGEEFGAREPFLFFCDFTGPLADAVRDGRRREFSKFPAFASPEAREKIPDPLAAGSFAQCKITSSRAAPDAELAELYHALLALRHREIIPHLEGKRQFVANYETSGPVLSVRWILPDGTALTLRANLSDKAGTTATPLKGRHIWGSADQGNEIPPWSVHWTTGTMG